MTNRAASRARITRMASTRSKKRPGGRARLSGKVYTVRFSDELATKIRARAEAGGIEFSTCVQLLVEDQLLTPEESAIRECRKHNAQRGVTPEMLMAAKGK